MNIFTIVAVKDELTETFLQPQFVDDEEVGKRIFSSQINNIQIWKDNPNDFTFWKLGEFNQETGVFESEIRLICNGRSVLKKEEQN